MGRGLRLEAAFQMREGFGVNERKRMAFGHGRRLLSGAIVLCFGLLAAALAPLALLAVVDNPLATITGAVCAAAGSVLASLAVALRRARKRLRDLHRRAEELADHNWELKEAEERARSLLEAQGDIIVRRDASSLVTYANDAFCKLCGRDRDDLLGSRFHPRVVEQGQAVLLADGTRGYDQKIESADGVRWIAWREVVVRAGEHTQVQSVGRDVTDRVEAQRQLSAARDQAEAASRAKSRFLAMISHEIRTPLSGMLGMSDLLLDTALTAEQTTYARAVKTSGDLLLSLIDEILDFSKIEAGRLDIVPAAFDLPALVEETVELIAPRAQQKNLDIGSYMDRRLPRQLVGDAARLRQVLLNLVGNAIKFTPAGAVAVMVEPSAEAGALRFSVSDTGIGIAASEQGRIFLEFEQAEGGASRKFGGTGLGLAISKRIIAGLGGTLAVESVPGAGSTFWFSLALAPVAAPDVLADQPVLRGTDVLIVAPTASSASMVARYLTDWGAHTCLVADEQTARSLLTERTWSAILLDRAIGAEACERLAQAAMTIDRRIALLTPSDRHAIAEFDRAGFTGYLVKPVRADSLMARMTAKDAGFERFEREAHRHTPPAAAGLPEAARPLAVLVAEDNEINALLAQTQLTRLGHRPRLVTSGDAAVEACLAAAEAGVPYDLLLMDLHMPGGDGLQALRRIRALEAQGRAPHLPVFALTANAFEEDREACLAAGMDGFLVKPLERAQLLDVLAGISARSLAA
jgi:PAS domain S-box-containing protein